MCNQLLALGREAKVAGVEQLLYALPDRDRASIVQSLHNLEQTGLAERLDGNAWLFPHQGKPRLSFSRTWSKPDGVRTDVLISATLANPRLPDITRLCLAYGLRRVRGNLDVLIEQEALSPAMIHRLRAMLDTIRAGFVTAARRRYERQLLRITPCRTVVATMPGVDQAGEAPFASVPAGSERAPA